MLSAKRILLIVSGGIRNGADVAKALRQLSNRPIKGRKYRARVKK